MNLYDCQKGKYYKITQLKTQDEILKHRLLTMGIYENAIISISHTTLTKSTIAVMIGNTQIALRGNEAKSIEVVAL
ncbi:MAG: FeoA family protein [Helicobacter sp.]|nr:FeoA family protein [Helicobacter sp.]MDY5740031.1 FeoA family protein [Helicobacter sp.]